MRKRLVAIAPLVLVLMLAACSGASSKAETVAEPASSPSAASIAPAKPEATKETSAMTVKEMALWDFETKTLEGAPATLADQRGKVVLVVNLASACGYTPQYAGLQALHDRYASKGFTVVGFPCNDFGAQEPGDAATIRSFCTERYAVTFPLHEKVVTKPGDAQSPIYAWLGATTGSLPSWNFCKYLIGKDGKPVQFWPSKVKPDASELTGAIETALAQ